MCNGDVQGFEIAGHRNLHGFIGNIDQVLVRTCPFVADEESDLAARYSVSSIPMFGLFKNGELADKRVGAMTAAALKEMIE